MVDLARLARDARRTAEWSRLRMALRATVIIGAITAVSIAAGGAIEACLGLGVTLLAGVVALRWWSREGVEAVRLGLAMGSVPLVAAWMLPACGVACAPPGSVGRLELLCVVAGVVAGVGLAWFAERRRRPWRAWMLSTAVAMLTATLGCVALGVTGLAVTVAAVLMVSTMVRVPLLLRAA